MEFKRIYPFLLAVIPAISIAQIPNWLPVNGLQAWYSFTGNTNDGTSNGFNGVGTALTSTIDRFGSANSAYQFNGTSSGILVPFDFLNNGGTEHSISMWFRSSSATVKQTMFNTNPHTGIGIVYNYNADYKVSMFKGSNPGVLLWDIFGNQLSGNVFPINQWHHFVFTKSNTTYRLWVNGNLEWANTYNSPLPVYKNCELRFGTNGVNAEYFNGKLDDIAIYDRALNSSDVNQIYHQCFTNFVTHPQNQVAIVGGSATFSASANSSSATTYRWIINSGSGYGPLNDVPPFVTNSGTQNLTLGQIASTQNNQQFRCISTVSSGCEDTSNAATLIVQTVGVAPSLNDNRLEVSPNPFDGNVRVAFQSPLGKRSMIYFSDALGKMILAIEPASDVLLIDTHTLREGIYFVHAEGFATVKLLKISR